jgi:hypothetical protein
MRIPKPIFVCICLCALTLLVWSQNQHVFAGQQAHGVPGYLDPQTGKFTTRAQSANPAVSETLTPRVAELIFNFDIAHDDQPSGDTTFCSVDISDASTDEPLYYTELAQSVATVTAGVGKCTVTIHFDWSLEYASTDTVSVCYSMAYFNTSSNIFEPRNLTHCIANIAMPANGATVTVPTIETYI